MRDGPILLTGATGYIGGKLLSLLEMRGAPVRCLVRRPGSLTGTAPTTEMVQGDVLDAASLAGAMEGVDVAYYLVHSLGSRGSFEVEDRVAAENFAHAAREAGVRRIVYLGGLGAGGALSSHLSSRQEVGQILAASGVPTVELRASIVIGSGSASFEMVRALVDRLPVMVTPRWVRTMAQPIAIDDVLAYLVAALDIALEESRVFEIGGADRVSYEDLMREYARQAGLRRLIVRVPLLTPRLSSLWLGLVTPLHARVGKKLIDSLPHETVVKDDAARRTFAVEPAGYREAIARAIESAPRKRRSFSDSRSVRVAVPPGQAFEPVARIGGDTGWYFADALWRLRGSIDLVAGGIGLRRRARRGSQLTPGAIVDFWRVEAVEPGRLLRLRAEMKLPGRAWLEFEVDGDASGSIIRQTATFEAHGLTGAAYWYALYPLHAYVFRGMIHALAEAAEARTDPGPPPIATNGGAGPSLRRRN